MNFVEGQVSAHAAPRVVGLSDDTFDLRMSLAPQALSFDWSLHADAFNDLVDSVQGNPDGYIEALDNVLCPAIDDLLLKSTAKLFSDRFTPCAKKGFQTEVSRAMSQHIKVALVEEMRTIIGAPNILIIGSGFGNDVKRLRRALFKAGKTACSIVALEPNDERMKQSQLENPDVIHIMDDYNKGYKRLLSYGPFDVIVATMSLQHIIGNNNDLAGPISSLLSARGFLVGTHFDHDSFFAHSIQVLNERGRSITVGARSRDLNTKLGVHPTKIYDTEFCDPYVNAALVAEYCVTNGMDYHYLKGAQAIAHYGTVALARQAKSKSVTTTLTSLLVARHTSILSYSSISRGVEVKIKPARVVKLMDPHYLTIGQTIFATKRDGVKRIAIARDGLLTLDTMESVPFPTYASPITFQLEEMNDRYYLVDAYRAEWKDKPIPFPMRLNLMSMVVGNFRLSKPVELNDFVLPLHAEDLMMFFLRVKNEEGFIMHNLNGYQSIGFSDAVYVKHKYTVDVIENGKIVEKFVTNGRIAEFYRDRPDKMEPNPPSTVEDTLAAPDLREVVEFMVAKADPHPLPNHLDELFAARDLVKLDANLTSILMHVHRLSLAHYECLPELISRHLVRAQSLDGAEWANEALDFDEPP